LTRKTVAQTYTAWRHCIEVECGLSLTPDFIAARRCILTDRGHEETERFIRSYGEAHWQRVVSWFDAAAADAGA
jgi:hypothetical protein